MNDHVQYYRYGNYLVPHHSAKSFLTADSQGDLGHVRFERQWKDDAALIKAAKKVCDLKCGLCPIQEKDFSGCPVTCHEDVRPWQCWVIHFKRLSNLFTGNKESND